ncbi:gelsolin-like protein 2 [Hydractinia symbiolongicarpus]|uniref:gelsolin-like protein 2 n=1 Tax=Hydractinia symbiolongicarpus TaxID=13093 RepID=UPI00254E917F|nr:gelsolin-like protein 2 [Hydractinia symbiolongicarpus]
MRNPLYAKKISALLKYTPIQEKGMVINTFWATLEKLPYLLFTTRIFTRYTSLNTHTSLQIEKWPKEDYEKFFSGDFYIILNTYKDKESDELLYDVHFWIGSHLSQDEYGTTAYKTVELDTFYDDKPIQHREVEGHESETFKSHFSSITLMKGGAASGFRHVKPHEYNKRLFQVVGERKNIAIKQIPMKKGNLNSDDVFIFDLGLEIYQYNGKNANKDEKFKATQYVQKLKSERGKAELEVLEENDVIHGHPVLNHLQDGKSKRRVPEPPINKYGMYCISDAKRHMTFTQVSDGKLNKALLDSNDVFLVDAGGHLFVWIGKGASIDERKNSMGYVHNFLKDKCNPFCPVTFLGEKQAKKSREFLAAFK